MCYNFPMKFNVVYNTDIQGYKEALNELEAILIDKKIDFKSFELNHLEHYGDFTIAIGGDGTILKSSRFYSEYSIPVLGINKGRLGFLSQAEMCNISDIVDMIIEGKYYTEDRLMLKSGDKLALNDFVIKGCDPVRTSKFYLEINGEGVCDYIADGLIISTPTGSTAYGLSAGGPVLYPTLDVLTIVPICPHTLNARPLVVPITEKISVKTSDKQLSLTADGFVTTQCLDKINIEISDKKAKLAFVNNARFYTVLRDKLHWGISPTGHSN